jgi:nucleoside-diphosphate-sugar epimerase
LSLLITGIHGFVGSNLVSALKERHSIYGLDIVSPEKDGIIKTYSWNEMDSLPEVDTIIHLAGKAHDTKNSTEAQTYFDINTGLTQKIFDYFLQSKAKQFILFSSVKAAADTVEGDCLTEEVIPKPVGPYGESKIAAENYILATGNRLPVNRSPFADCPKSVYIFRPCMIHGPGNKGNLNLLYKFVNKGIPYPLGAFENKRSFLNIWNLSYIVEQFIQQNPASGIYHLADDGPVSTNELIKLIALSKGKKAKIWNCNKNLIKSIARVGDVCKLPLNSDRLQKLTENYVVSTQKMKQALGIERLPVNSIEGLERTLRTF